jgi:DNA-binding NtrC family response regulator
MPDNTTNSTLRYPNVLLFASDQAEADILQRLLGEHVALTPVTDRSELADLLECSDYDALFWSWSFRAGTWNDALREVHRIRPDLPVIILSTAPEEHAWIRSLEAGAFDLLAAPFDGRQLLATLEQASSSREAQSSRAFEPMLQKAGA